MRLVISVVVSSLLLSSISLAQDHGAGVAHVGGSYGNVQTVVAALPDNDDFERASLGSNWTQASGNARNCQIDSSSDLEASATGDTICLWNVNTPNQSSYACTQISNNTTNIAGVCLGVSSTGSAICCVALSTTAGWELDDFTDEGFVGVRDNAADPDFAVGDYIGIQRTSATAYRCYRSTNGTSWTALGSGGTSSLGDDPGSLGAYIFSGNNKMLELWEGGNGSLPTGSACGTND